MNKYLKDVTTIIRDGSMDNSYKMSWIRSIFEYYSKNPKTSIKKDYVREFWYRCKG